MGIREFCVKYKIVLIILFILDLIIPDPIPFLDEIILCVGVIIGIASPEDKSIKNSFKMIGGKRKK